MKFFSSLSTFHANKFGIKFFSDPLLTKDPLFFSFEKMLGKSIIITGESESGKTQITAEFIRYCSESRLKDKPKIKFLIFDMAPKRFQKKNRFIGGKLDEFFPSLSSLSSSSSLPSLSQGLDRGLGIKYYDFENILPARSNAITSFDVFDSCLENFKEINPHLKNEFEKLFVLMKKGINEPICVVINDLSIFFHLGSPQLLIKLLKIQKNNPFLTIFLNSYEGSGLINDFGSNISNREIVITNLIKKHCDLQIFLRK